MSIASTRILIVDDEEIVRESLSGWLEKDGYTVATAPDGPTALARLANETWSILLVDMKMPGMDGLQVLAEARKLQASATVVIMTVYATVETAVSAMKIGAYDYLVKPFDPEELTLMIQKIVKQDELVRENETLRRALKRDYHFRDLISKSSVMQTVFDLARTAARSQSTILVLGESGTGKELLARAIHAAARGPPRRSSPWPAGRCPRRSSSPSSSATSGAPSPAPSGRSGASSRRPTAERSSSTRSPRRRRRCRSSSCARSRRR